MIIQQIRWVHHGLSPRVLNANALRAKSLHANEGLRAELNAEKRCDVFAKTNCNRCLQIPPIYLIHVCLRRQWNDLNLRFANNHLIRIQAGRVANNDNNDDNNNSSHNRNNNPMLFLQDHIIVLLVAQKPKPEGVVIKA